MEEPFAGKQFGSSAMAYKRNPRRSERISSLSRFILSLAGSPAITASTQWFERTLDDSANRRLVIPQAFLAADAVLNLYLNVSDGMVVYEKVIARHIARELPFMATETILMKSVQRGGDRQELHEKIREYSMQAAYRVKAEGGDNNLAELIRADIAFPLDGRELDGMMKPENFTGMAELQTERFINDCVHPVLGRYEGGLDIGGEVDV
jgi:adenylosuccinate lyase